MEDKYHMQMLDRKCCDHKSSVTHNVRMQYLLCRDTRGGYHLPSIQPPLKFQSTSWHQFGLTKPGKTDQSSVLSTSLALRMKLSRSSALHSAYAALEACSAAMSRLWWPRACCCRLSSFSACALRVCHLHIWCDEYHSTG